MNIYRRWLHARNKKTINRFVETLGHRVGWTIEGKEVVELWSLNEEMFVEALDAIIFKKKSQFLQIDVDLTKRCREHHVQIEEGKTELQLMYCDTGTRILITRYSEVIQTITQFRLLYRGIGWTISKVDDKVDFCLDLFNELMNRVHNAKSDDEKLQTVRHLNWIFCTLNDIETKVRNWEISVPTS